MTKRFLEDGGKIRVISRTFSSGMNSVGYKDKVSNYDSPLNWSEELNMKSHWDREHFLSPFNIYSKRNDDDWNESNHLCENREFWTEKMIPLMKEEDSDWESSCELDDRLDDMNEIASRY